MTLTPFLLIVWQMNLILFSKMYLSPFLFVHVNGFVLSEELYSCSSHLSEVGRRLLHTPEGDVGLRAGSRIVHMH